MSRSRVIRAYGYVDRSYDEVRALIQNRAGELFERATNSANARAKELMAKLTASVGGIDVGVDIWTDLAMEPSAGSASGLPPVTRLAVRWKASQRASLFPSMSAGLTISPMAFAETRVEFEGTYEPPLGLLGGVLDATVGHQVAEATVRRFVDDVIEQIRLELPRPSDRSSRLGDAPTAPPSIHSSTPILETPRL